LELHRVYRCLGTVELDGRVWMRVIQDQVQWIPAVEIDPTSAAGGDEQHKRGYQRQRD
jgi:hypothetical protein